MSLREAAENITSVTTPIPVGVSGITLIGITVEDWVLIATALLVTFQIIVTAPKAWRTVKAAFTKEKPNGGKC